MKDKKQEFTRLLALWEGDGSAIKEQIIFAGLLLMIFERFKCYVVDQVDGFFAEEFFVRDGSIQYKRGEKFKHIIKEKGAHKPGQHANKDFRAALHWFLDLGAVTPDEADSVERFYIMRNEIGHELLQIIADDRKEPITLMDVIMLFDIYVKIVRWWVKEVEATTDPDFDQEKYESTDWGAVETIDTIILRQIMHKALQGVPLWESLRSAVKET